MDYHYYVVYQWVRGEKEGFSSCSMDSNKAFDTKAGLDALYQHLKNERGYDALVVLNIIPLKD